MNRLFVFILSIEHNRDAPIFERCPIFKHKRHFPVLGLEKHVPTQMILHSRSERIILPNKQFQNVFFPLLYPNCPANSSASISK